jgi:Leucine-rich repeat (LRR) protein
MYGHDRVTQHDIDSLKNLSSLAKCWIIFHNLTEETPIEIDDWNSKYQWDIIHNPDLLNG